MNVILRRTSRKSYGIFSDMFDERGVQIATCLERAYDQPGDKWEPKVPNGVYTCKRYHSPKFGYDVFEVLNVPHCDYIEIHRGNVESESQGCILIGSNEQGQAVLESKLAFLKFMEMQKDVDEFTLVVEW